MGIAECHYLFKTSNFINTTIPYYPHGDRSMAIEIMQLFLKLLIKFENR